MAVLLWADVFAGYVMWVMITYLTDVWKISFTHAAGIVNIWSGVAMIMPIGSAFLVDTLIGNYSMLLLSSIAYSIGLGFLAMSTPPVLHNATGTCREYRPECIGHVQQILFYAALALIAVGISGHVISLGSFSAEQTTSDTEEDDETKTRKFLWQILGIFAIILVLVIAATALAYIKPWSVRFGIPAICTLVATIIFLGGSCSYNYESPKGSPLTTVFRVFAASAAKLFQQLPSDSNQLYEKDEPDFKPLPHTPSLRCFDKAAIMLPTPTQEEQEKNRWRLCRVTEVEETKMGIRMIPMWMTFIICGVVLSIGNTYFLEQANHMNRKVGRLTVPLPFLLVLYDFSKSQFAKIYAGLAKCLGKYAPPVCIALAMLFSILCCITAAKVETRRLDVIRRHGLLDKPDEKIPMSMFWLLPQFILLAGLDQIFNMSITGFLINQAPATMKTKEYLDIFTTGVLGLGTAGSVLSVYIVGKISEKGGKPSWFRYTLNKSRLDNYYWTLAALSAVNLVLFIVVASFYSYKEPRVEDQEAPEVDESDEPYDDNAQCFCCCG
ncbi:hypothetical protein RJ640_018376 [Escallonia rubra]|uniref:Uncharacterized protein n=1 Tax=Escallonia rubra TaxID=112253 RepID=A0AA88QBA6_9ASTE|nr:hypothetical protein RJ640_018376 [Escallonia rubra]